MNSTLLHKLWNNAIGKPNYNKDEWIALESIFMNLSFFSDDSELLDWLDSQGEAYGFENEHHGNRWGISVSYGNIRLAIKDSMKEQK